MVWLPCFRCGWTWRRFAGALAAFTSPLDVVVPIRHIDSSCLEDVPCIVAKAHLVNERRGIVDVHADVTRPDAFAHADVVMFANVCMCPHAHMRM